MDAHAPGSSTTLTLTNERAQSGNAFVSAVLELCKARLNSLVLLTTAVGFLLATPGAVDWGYLLMTLIGAGAAAFGANALNQLVEADRDARMRRTCRRPLPSGQLSTSFAFFLGLGLCVAGPCLLLIIGATTSAALAASCAALYVLVYTPMKVRSHLNTLVGAVCGAIPPLIGWSAVSGGLPTAAWALGAILFVWQIPHFLALAWLYREDYERGGFRMLPLSDPSGHMTAKMTLLYSLTLAPIGMSLNIFGAAGPIYAIGALLLTGVLVVPAVRFVRERSDAAARRVFLASVIYLPLLLAIMVIDRLLRA